VNNLILFDFDGTITRKDSLREFLIYYHGWTKVCLGLLILSPILVLYVLNVISNHSAKQILLQYFFNKEPSQKFNEKCTEFAIKQIPGLLRIDALQQLKLHLSRNETIVVVSASPENWIKPWSDQMGLRCIATRLEIKDNQLTGRFSGKNCYGPEKVNRIKQEFDLSSFAKIIAYGDSRGDQEIFALADQYYYRTFPLT